MEHPSKAINKLITNNSTLQDVQNDKIKDR